MTPFEVCQISVPKISQPAIKDQQPNFESASTGRKDSKFVDSKLTSELIIANENINRFHK